MNFTIEQGNVFFDVCFHWPKADVDAVYAEAGGMFQGKHKVATDRTPTAGSVERILDVIQMRCNEYWKSLGVVPTESWGLMMGCASVRFETTPDKYSPELVKRVKTDCQRLMVAGVRYYKQDKVVGHNIEMGCAR